MTTRGRTYASATGLSTFAAAVVAMHVLDPGLSIRAQTLSEYVHGPASPLLLVALVAWSVSLAALAWLVASGVRRHPDPLAPIQAAAIFSVSVAVLLLALFPTDRGAELAGQVTDATAAGRVHDLAGLVAIAGFLCAVILGSIRASRTWRWVGLFPVAVAISADAILLALGDPAPGLRQRLLVFMACTWQVLSLLELTAASGELRSTSDRSNEDFRGSTS
jgi:hypothetical protein